MHLQIVRDTKSTSTEIIIEFLLYVREFIT